MAFDDLSVRQKIAAMYVGYFGRAADPDGLDYWIKDYNTLTASGYSELDALINIATSFAKSDEATSLYPYLKYPTIVDSDSFIDRVYENLFGHTADQEGKDYWKGFLGDGTDELAVGKFILAVMRGAQGSDINVMENRAEVSEYYAVKVATEGANWTLADDGDDARSVISGVTADSATVTAAKSTADTLIANDLAAGSTFTLTTGADSVNGTDGNDTISGGIGTLANMDEIDGKGGTDTLTVFFAPEYATAGGATAAAPVIKSVEVLNITTRSNSAQLDFIDIKGVTSLNVMGNRDLKLVNISDLTSINVNGFTGTLTVDLETATASTAAFGLTLNMTNSTAAQVVWADDSGNTALVDTLTINAVNDVSLNSGSTFPGVEKIVAAGDGKVTLRFETATAFSDLTANNTAAGIDASNLSGNLSVTFTTGLNATTSNMNIKGGAGNDTFAFNIAGNTSTFTGITIDGGAGTDTIRLIHSTSDFNPVLSNVETMDLRASAAALVGGMTAVFTAVQGLNTLTLGADNVSAIKITGIASTLNTINIVTSNSTAADLSVFYTGAASSVTLNLGPTTVTSYANPVNGSATAVGFGDITVSGATGAFSLNVAGTAAFNVDSITLGNFTAATIKAASGNFTLSGNFSGAVSTLTLDASGGSLTFCGGIIATAATSVTLNAADGKDISINCAVLRGGGKLEVILGNTGSDVTINALDAATASSQFELKISGSGNFTLATGLDIGSGITVNLTGLSTPGSFNIDFSCATVPICATFGLASGTFYAGKASDVFVFDNSASHTIVLSNATLSANVDIVKNFGSGDRIVFPGITAAATNQLTGVLVVASTAGSTAAAAFANASLSAVAATGAPAVGPWIGIYTASGNTIIEVASTTAATAGFGDFSGGLFYRIVLENFDNALTGVFRLDTNTALGGLMITLL